jgi:hypothetical protein
VTAGPARPVRVPRCWDCGVAVGEPCLDGCDVARCMATGFQRLSCDQQHPGDCGWYVFEGTWPGEPEAFELGWLLPGAAEHTGRPLGDLNRVYAAAQRGELRWDPARQRFIPAH